MQYRMPEVMEGSVLLGVGGAWPLLAPSSSFSSALVDDDGQPEKKKKQPSSADTSRLLGSASARAEDQEEKLEQAAVVRSLSFSKLLSFRIARAPSSLSSSLDINIAAAEHADAPAINDADESSSSTAKKTMTMTKQLASSHRMICRSQSLPMSTRPRGGSKRVADSSSLNQNGRKLFRVSVIAGPACDTEAKQQQQQQEEKEEEHEDVAEEDDLVCRICMVALSEGGRGTLKLECRCKGELALAHGDCAVRWFSIKGNANCDVCNHEVLNLPVTLRRLHHQHQHQLIQDQLDEEDAAAAASMRNGNLMNLRGSSFRVWRGTPILAVVSMLAYFCFLEQLLVGDHGTAPLCPSPASSTSSPPSLPQRWCPGDMCGSTRRCSISSSCSSPTSSTDTPLLQIRANAGGDLHHPVHLCGLRRRHLHQRRRPPDHDMEDQAGVHGSSTTRNHGRTSTSTSKPHFRPGGAHAAGP